MSLLRYLFRTTIQSKLPRLPRTLINPRERRQSDEAAERLMMAGVARDEYAALDLVRRHGLPIGDLIRLLTKRRKPDWKRRLMNRLRSLEGSSEYDPYRTALRKLKRGENPNNSWM
jgi:hypothetical protein